MNFGFYGDGFKDVISEGREFGYDFVCDGVFYVEPHPPPLLAVRSVCVNVYPGISTISVYGMRQVSCSANMSTFICLLASSESRRLML